MQTQASSYKPSKPVKGIKKGSQQVRTGQKPKKTGNNLKRVQNRKGKKTTVTNGSPKSMAMNNGYQNIQAQSNMPGLNFPMGPLM